MGPQVVSSETVNDAKWQATGDERQTAPSSPADSTEKDRLFR